LQQPVGIVNPDIAGDAAARGSPDACADRLDDDH
jgi:hypothetical protein